MIHAHKRFPPQKAQHPRRNRDALQRRAHPGPLGEADAVNVSDARAGLAQRPPDETDDEGAVVAGGLLRHEAFAGRGIVGVADVGADDGGAAGAAAVAAAVRWVLDEADAELVRGAFEADGEHGLVGWLGYVMVLQYFVQRVF